MNKLLVAALLSAFVAVPAFAGEGGRTPFPFTTGGQITPAVPQGFDVGQAQLPVLPDSYSFAFNGVPTLPQNGQNGEVATAYSLPRNAMVGTVQYAQAQSIARWFASRTMPGSVASRRVGRPGT